MRHQKHELKERLEPPLKQIKLQQADKTFCQFRNYLQRSSAINEKQLVTWASKPMDPIKTHVCTKLFHRKDFRQLVEHALAANRIEGSADNWHETHQRRIQ